MAHVEEEIRKLVDAFIANLRPLITKAALETVARALGGPRDERVAPARVIAPGAKRSKAPAAATTSPDARPTARRKGRRRMRSAAQMAEIAERVLTHVRANPGDGVTQIAEALGMSSSAIEHPIEKLVLEKKLTATSGGKRGVRSFRIAGAGRSRSVPPPSPDDAAKA